MFVSMSVCMGLNEQNKDISKFSTSVYLGVPATPQDSSAEAAVAEAVTIIEGTHFIYISVLDMYFRL